MSKPGASAGDPSGQLISPAAHLGRSASVSNSVRIRGRVSREPLTKKPLQARRSLSIALIRAAPAAPVTAFNGLIEIPPIGLAYLAASLKKAGHRVRIIDAFGEQPSQLIRHADGYYTQGLTPEQIVEHIPPDVDLVGVTCMFSTGWFYCHRTISHIAATFRDAPIIVGGEHPTADYERLLQRVPEVLCCVLGEGEETVVDIAAHLSHGLPLDDVPGIAVRNAGGDVYTTPDRQRILEVDEIPWPDWDTVPLPNYLDNNFGLDGYYSRTMPIVASRGCPYQCTFCSSPQMFGTKWTARSPRDVLAEMQHDYDAFGARHFEFHDLTMIVRKDWIVEFCNLLIERKLDVQWSMPSGTRSEVLDAEVLALMKRSGCRSFAYAAESGSPAELKRIKKRINLQRMLDSMRQAVKLELVTRCHLICGMPDQTKWDVLATLGFVTRLAWVGVHDVGCYAFSPYPGSEIYQRLVAEGRIDTEADDYEQMLAQQVTSNYKLRRSWTPHLPAWSVGWICVGTMSYFYALQFLFRPQRLVAVFQSLVRNRPHTYLQRVLVRKLGVGDAIPVPGWRLRSSVGGSAGSRASAKAQAS